MKIFDNISLLEHISQERKPGQANTSHAKFHAHPEDNTPSLLVYIHSNTYANFTKINESTGKVMGGSILDYEINENNKTSHEAILYLKDKYKIVDEKKLEKVKQPKRKELITNFTNIKASGNNDISILNTFLSAKGFGYKFLQDNQKVFEELSQEIGVYPGLFLSEDAGYGDVIIFPCKDSNNNLIGGKIRRKDCELIGDCKSVAIGGMTTGLMYSSLDNFKQYAIIVEGETDYITLKLLGFKNVIGNLAGVSGGTDIIKELTKKTKKIFCLYDNDNAGIKGSQGLQRVLNRPIYLPVYPKIEGKDNYDIHDLFKMGYCKKDFQDILKGSILFPEETSNKEKTSFSFKERGLTFNDVDRVVFLDKDMAFYDTEQMTYRKKTEVADLFQIPAGRVFEKVKVIKGLTYSQNGEKGYLNLLNKENMIKPSNNIERPGLIGRLIDNLCNYEDDAVEWLERAILYRYTHLDSYMIPIVVFHGSQGSGKGLFIEMMGTMLGQDNIVTGGQDALESEFSVYKGNKLIVNFDEITVNRPDQDIRNANKIKGMAMNPTVQARLMYKGTESARNCAWFFITSNGSAPVRLEHGELNRRYTVLRSTKSLPYDIAGLIYSATHNEEIIGNYLGYLFHKYGDVVEGKVPLAFENESKQSLIMASTTEQSNFFESLRERLPWVVQFSYKQIKDLTESYQALHGYTTELKFSWLKQKIPHYLVLCRSKMDDTTLSVMKHGDNDHVFKTKKNIDLWNSRHIDKTLNFYVRGHQDICSLYLNPDKKVLKFFSPNK